MKLPAVRMEEAGLADIGRVEISGRFVSVGVGPLELENRGSRGKRGEISSYSARSAKRLARRLGALGDVWDEPVLWVTGTFSTSAAPGVDAARKTFKLAWRDWSRELAEEAFAIWKREFTRNGTIHYHFFLFGCGGADLRELREGWGRRWCAAARAYGCYVPAMEHAAVSVEWWRGGGDRCGYALKEAGKGIGVVEGVDGASIGRSWGILNRLQYLEACRRGGGVERVVSGPVTSTFRVLGGIVQEVVEAEMRRRVKGTIRSYWAILPASAAIMVADLMEHVTTMV